MLRYRPDRTYARFDGRTAREYLDSLNFPPAARRMLFDVFSHSFFNPEEEMSAADLLKHNASPSDAEIREWLEGNLCRCTGYHNIVKSIRAAAARMGG